MNYLSKYVHKTLRVAQTLGYDLMKDFDTSNFKTITQKVLTKFSTHTKNVFLTHQYQDMIMQLLMTEIEKFNLINTSKTQQKEIISNYKDYNTQREHLFSIHNETLQKMALQKNPFIECYVSEWKFIFNDHTEGKELLENILEFPKGEYYFLFQKTDVFDDVLQTNILEFDLTKYEYYTLQLFENKTIVNDVIKEFMNAFDIQTEEEYKILTKEITRIVNYLIFRKFIVN